MSLYAATHRETFVDVLEAALNRNPHRVACRFLETGEVTGPMAEWTYEELLRRVRAIAAELVEHGLVGERVILLYPPGLEFVAAFYACLHAGAVAVPAYPPDPARMGRSLPRLRAMAVDAGASAVLTTAVVGGMAQALLPTAPELGKAKWIHSDQVDRSRAEDWRRPNSIRPDSLAFLQYTSGSTGDPKGVMVSHANIVHNQHMIHVGMGGAPSAHVVSWLPLFHDMGLIGTVMHAHYLGATTTLMSPISFLQRPFRWLKMISHFRADMSGGPNFGYALCAQKVTEEELSQLDLACWEVAFNGAEPVRADTLERFAEFFSRAGFRRDALYPTYGLAEATLMVSGGRRLQSHHVSLFDTDCLAHGRGVARAAALDETGVRQVSNGESRDEDTVQLVSCGTDLPGQRIRIVDPERGTECEPGRVGEIWVGGPHIASGYWGREELSKEVFGARLLGGEGPYLRTGDLGFREGESLYVNGRAKDLIVIRGTNHYPQDIERTVEGVDSAVRPGSLAAFGVEHDGEESLVVAFEVDEKSVDDPAGLAKRVRQSILENHQLNAFELVVLRKGTIPKTSSGKIQRRICRQYYLSGTLEVVASWTRGASSPSSTSTPTTAQRDAIPLPATAASSSGSGSRRPRTARSNEAERTLVDLVARRAGIAASEIELGIPIANYGFDSKALVELAVEIEQKFGVATPPSTLFDYPTVESLARHLVGQRSVDTAPVDSASDPIAVVGIGCRYPGGIRDVDSFWEFLVAGRDAIGEVPRDRFDLKLHHSDEPRRGKTYSRFGGFLDDVAEFDPGFFGISPREAEAMDPQQRVLLEVSHEALEHAGHPVLESGHGNTGVFIGVSSSDYANRTMLSGVPTRLDTHSATGVAFSALSGRLSYLFGWSGPSMTVDTACSSSLTAVHLAVRALRAGECERALAGGVNLILSPSTSIYCSQIGALSPDGRCKTFDASANGYVRSEGCGIVVLKRLSDALRDGDRVLGVIRGSAVNQDGRSNGLLAPNGVAQQDVVARALRDAGVQARDVQYVEAHGTGTPLGDGVELNALNNAFCRDSRAEPLWIGSVKSNIGHAESAAGIAGLIKTVLMLHHERLIASLHVQTPTPQLDWEKSPLRVVTETQRWGPGVPIAGVSSFGFTGTNAHVIVSQAPVRQRATTGASPKLRDVLLPLSAKSQEALRELAIRYVDVLHGAPDLAELASNVAHRRDHHAHRLVALGSSAAELATQLRAFARGEATAGNCQGQKRGGSRPYVAFVFPGQGGQRVAMGRQLLRDEPVFRDAFTACDAEISHFCDFSVLELIESDDSAWLEHIEQIQPTLFALQYSLATLIRSWGVEPDVLVGHSMGEIAAAAIAGAFSLRDAAKLVCLRSRSLRRLRGRGAMALVDLPAADVSAELERYADKLSVAVINGPRTTVIGGDPDALDVVLADLTARGVFCRKVRAAVASHTSQVDLILDEIREAFADLEPRAGVVPMLSTVDERLHDGSELSADYWASNLRQPVRFESTIRQITQHHRTVIVEIGPQPTLRAAIEQTLASVVDDDASRHRVFTCLHADTADGRAMLRLAGELYASGVDPDWRAMVAPVDYRVELPFHPFMRQRYWLDEPAPARQLTSWFSPSDRPELRYRESTIELEREAFWSDHRLADTVVFPAAGFITHLLDAVRELRAADDSSSIVLRHFEFDRAMPLPGDRRIQLRLEEEGRQYRARIASRAVETTEPASLPSNLAWTTHAFGTVVLSADDDTASEVGIDTLRERCREVLEVAAHYARLEKIGLRYGPAFARMSELRRGPHEALARISGPIRLSGTVHPATLDACFQALFAIDVDELSGSWQAVSVGRVVDHGAMPSGDSVWAHARIRERSPASILADIDLLDEQGGRVMSLRRFELKHFAATAAGEDVHAASAPRQSLLEGLSEVVWKPVSSLDGETHSVARSEIRRCLILGNGAESKCLRDALAARNVSVAKLRMEQSDGEWEAKLAVADIVVVCVGQGAVRGVDASSGALTEPIELICGGVARLTPLMSQSISRPRLYVVSHRGQRVTELDEVDPLASIVWGLGASVGYEFPQLRTTRIDLESDYQVDQYARLAEVVLADSHFDQLAVRRSELFFASLRRCAERVVAAEELSLSAQSTYLVSGSLHGFGYRLAESLIRRGARHLVLAGREAAPDPEQLECLAALGAQIDFHRFDAECGQLDTLIDSIGGSLRGVFHVAEMLHEQTVFSADYERAILALRIEVSDAWELHRVTERLQLDHFALCSSAGAVFGYPAQPAFAAAHAFFDGLAHFRAYRALPANSIAWGPLSAKAPTTSDANVSGLISIGLSEAQSLFPRLLEGATTHLTIAPFDHATWSRSYGWMSESPFWNGLLNEAPAPAPRPRIQSEIAAESSPRRRYAILERFVLEQLGEVLRSKGHHAIDRTTPLQDLGIDSLMAMELRNRLEGPLGLSLSVSLLWICPDIEALVSDLLARMQAHELDVITQTIPAGSMRPSATPSVSPTGRRSDIYDRKSGFHVNTAAPSRSSGPPNPWFRLKGEPKPRMRIFCFPYAGGNEAIFRDWNGHMHSGIQVCAAAYPGRLSRVAEPPIESMDQLIDGLIEGAQSLLDLPFVLYGHSMGGLVAFEFARRLRSRLGAKPAHLFVGAFPAPQLVSIHPRLHEVRQALLELDFEKVSGTPAPILQDREALDMMSASIVPDVRISERYRYRAGERLDIPLTAFGGERDPYVTQECLDAWREQTSAEFDTKMLKGAGHFFVHEQAPVEELLLGIGLTLAAVPPPPRRAELTLRSSS